MVQEEKGQVTPPPLPLSREELDRRIAEEKAKGNHHPSIFDLDPEFKKWYYGGRGYQAAIVTVSILLGIAAIVMLVML
jgi:hypothetical protein